MNHTSSISTCIIEGSRHIWDEYYAHPFVLGISDGTLPKEKFQYFMVQDYLYLIDYAKVFSIGAAKAEDMDIARAFNTYVSCILDGEMNIHKNYMKRLGIQQYDILNARSATDTLNYTSYMLRIAYEAGTAEICAAILPCAVSYEKIAKKMVEENPDCITHPFFGEWIKGYASEEYHEENEALIALTEKAAAGCSVRKINKLVDIGIRCSTYEKLFWDMAWEMRR